MAITKVPTKYRSDKASLQYFKEWGKSKTNSELRTSPLHSSLQDTEAREVPGYRAHSYGEINPWKVCEIAITSFHSGHPLGLNNGAWGNWRNQSVLQVYDKVLLWPKEKEWTASFANSYESAYGKLDQQGLLSKVSQISEAARSLAMVAGANIDNGGKNGGRFMSKYKEAPAWAGTKPLQLASNLSFNFRFGQAGAFSGEHEVVRPIIALAAPFAPRSASAGSNYMIGPAPTAPAFFWYFIKGTAGLMGNITEDLKKNMSQKSEEPGLSAGIKQGLSNLVSAATDVEERIINHMNTTIAGVLNGEAGNGAVCLNVRIGQMVFPPMLVKDVSWTFDMTHTDEEGYPLAGTITFSGLEGLEITSQSLIASIYPNLPYTVQNVQHKETAEDPSNTRRPGIIPEAPEEK
jgi:hypothetical protein